MIQLLGRLFTWNVMFRFSLKNTITYFSKEKKKKKKKKKEKKNVVYCSSTFKVTHRPLDNMHKFRALDNMKPIYMNRRR